MSNSVTRQMQYIGWTVATVLLLTGPMFSQSDPEPRREGRFWVTERNGATQATKKLLVRSTGNIFIRGAAHDQIQYHAVMRVKGSGDEQWARQILSSAGVMIQRQEDGTVLISLRRPDCQSCVFEAQLVIDTPNATRLLSINTQGGLIEVKGVSGEVLARSMGGPIVMDDIGASVQAITAGGFVRLGTIGGSVDCETAGGGITLEQSGGPTNLMTRGGGIQVGSSGGDLRAETSGGSIRILESLGNVLAATAGGSIYLGNIRGVTRASTAGGSIEAVAAHGGIYAETAAGDIRLDQAAGKVVASSAAGNIRASFLKGAVVANSLLETTGGSIIVSLPALLPLTIDASVRLANSLRSIISDFASINIHRVESFAPGAVVADGQINGGGSLLQIRNEIGRIEIRKQR